MKSKEVILMMLSGIFSFFDGILSSALCVFWKNEYCFSELFDKTFPIFDHRELFEYRKICSLFFVCRKKEESEELKIQKLARYQHFITCPSCHLTGNANARNQVLIPCGHLICNKCQIHTENDKKCPLCDAEIENYQLLLIG